MMFLVLCECLADQKRRRYSNSERGDTCNFFAFENHIKALMLQGTEFLFVGPQDTGVGERGRRYQSEENIRKGGHTMEGSKDRWWGCHLVIQQTVLIGIKNTEYMTECSFARLCELRFGHIK